MPGAKPGIFLCSKRHRTNFRGPSASHGRKRWIRGWSTASSTARPSWVWARQAGEVRYHAQVSRRFPLQKDRGRSLSKASTRAYVSSSPSLARPFVINNSSGMRITQLGGLLWKGLRRHRPEDHLSHVPSIRHVHGLEGVGPRCRTQLWEQLRGTPPLVHWRRFWNLTASVERCWLPGAFDHDQDGVR